MFGLKKKASISSNFICREGISIPGIDNIPDSMKEKLKNVINNLTVKAIVDNNSLNIKSTVTALKIPDTIINFKDIKIVKSVTGQEIIEKHKNVAGRAFVGDLLLGIPGAILLGLTGIGTKEKIINKRYLIINTKDDKAYILEYVPSTDYNFIDKLKEHLE